MAKGRGRAGTHTSLTDAARPVAEALERHGRVSRGVIGARVGAGKRDGVPASGQLPAQAPADDMAQDNAAKRPAAAE